MSKVQISVVVPTYGREDVLVETLRLILAQQPRQLIVVDQTAAHSEATTCALEQWREAGVIQILHRDVPSIPAAMNAGLLAASSDVVLFLDDDIVPSPGLLKDHLTVHETQSPAAVVGQVLQPGEEPVQAPNEGPFRFSSAEAREVTDVMAGNLSVNRALSLAVGGFDERFEGAAYRFESEFAERLRASGGRILFAPQAGIRHLRHPKGGTRARGEHWRTISPSHAVGGYLYLLITREIHDRNFACLARFARAVLNRKTLVRPWLIPGVALAEGRGFLRAQKLARRPPLLLGEQPKSSPANARQSA